MKFLMSPAKTMSSVSSATTPTVTIPQFKNEADMIIRELLKFPADELKSVLKLSPKLALERMERLRSFFSPNVADIPAILAYTGVVFKNMSPKDFTAEDFLFAQDNLRIVSVAYGLLRALDGIRPYRLEYDVKLPELEDDSLYNFWKNRQTDCFIDEIKNDDGILVNLASKDVQPSFDWKKVCKEVRVITPEFLVNKNGKPKTVVIYAKMLRGQMSRFIIKNKISDPELLKTFEWEGFYFRPEMSDADRWIFMA